MTNFVKDQFQFDGMYLTYGTERRFVARFKNFKGDRGPFQKFLIANFTVEEYFHAYEVERIPPVLILRSKGFVTPRVVKLLGEAAARKLFATA